LLEETSCLHVDTHSSEHDGKVLLVVVQHRLADLLNETGLTANLSGNL
jgi:hypothetical protein